MAGPPIRVDWGGGGQSATFQRYLHCSIDWRDVSPGLNIEGLSGSRSYCETGHGMGRIFGLEYSNSCLNFIRSRAPARSNTDGHVRSDQTRSEGRQLPVGSASTQRYFHPGGPDRRPEADRADRGRVCIEGSAAAGERPGKQEAGADAGTGAEGRGARSDERQHAGRIWRGGAGQNRDDAADGEDIRVRGFCGDAWSALRHRDAADRLFRYGRAEEEIPAQAGERGNDRRLLPFGATSRERRAKFADARGTKRGR